jgi:hypothetical protein
MFRFIFKKELRELNELRDSLLIQKGILEEQYNNVLSEGLKIDELYKDLDELKSSLKSAENDLKTREEFLSYKEDELVSNTTHLNEEKVKFLYFSFKRKEVISNLFKELHLKESLLKSRSSKLSKTEKKLKAFEGELKALEDSLIQKENDILDQEEKEAIVIPEVKVVETTEGLFEIEKRGKKMLVDKMGNFKGFIR